MNFLQKIIYFICLFFIMQVTYAQTGDKVELIGADDLFGVVKNGQEYRKLIGNVKLKQQATFLYCDSAYLFSDRNFVEVFSNVRVVQGDTVTITGNKGTYDGNSRQADMEGNVVLVDKTMTLYTDELDYNMNTNLAYYYTGGRILDGENNLTSQQGYYDTRSKLFFFKKDVVLINPSYTLKSDTLQYHSVSKVAYFKGPTEVISSGGDILHTVDGQYNTVTQASTFRGRTTIDYGKYTLTGDSVFYDKIKEMGIARRNVILVAKEDSTIIEGDIARYNGKLGISKVYGHALMKSISAGDTLFLTADTLLSVDDTINKSRRLFAYNKVKIFKSDLQGKCDSLLYNFTDSTIYFFRDPVLWSTGNQLLADSIHIQMANNKVDKMYLKSNAFVINQDTILNFNQLKGRMMTAYFTKTDSKLDRIHVDGNGESIYFALDEEDNTMMGMNKMLCGRMVIRFVENKVNTIRAITSPDAVFTPPHEIEEPSKRLKGFSWRIEEKPKRTDVMVRSPAL